MDLLKTVCVLSLLLAAQVASANTQPNGRTQVYDLLRLAPHGLEMPVTRLGEGHPSLAAIVGGFNTGFTLGDGGALEARGDEAEIVLPLAPKKKYVLKAEVTPHARARSVTLFVNGRRAGRARLSAERQSIEIAVPPVVARKHGDTFLTFAFHGRARPRGRLFRGRRLTSKPTREPLRATFHRIEVRPTEQAEASRVLAVHALIPVQATFAGNVQGTGVASVRVAAGQSDPQEIARSDARTGSMSGDLGAFAGRIVRIELVTSGEATWQAARIEAPTAPPRAQSNAPKPRNVVLWFIDTLRADKLRCVNPETRVRTPNFDAFAHKGVLFRRALSQSSHSKPAAATLLTGRYPASHGARAHQDKLRRDAPTLAQIFRRAGFATAGFASNGFISKKHGFVRGWDRFQNLLLTKKGGKAPYLMSAVDRWLASHEASGNRKPFFLYVHSVDPHVPYNPPRDILSMYWKGPYRGRLVPRLTGFQLDDARAGKFRVGPIDRQYAEALYDGEVSVADRFFGRFLDALERRGLAKDTLIVVTADHGEEFWDHGQPGHGHTLYNELIGVPLLFGGGPFVPQGRTVDASVEMVDVAPTLLDLAGIPAPDGAQGRSLVPHFYADAPASPVAFSVHEGRIAAAQQGRYKYILYRGGAERVFDLDADPREQTDLSPTEPHVRRHLRALLSTWLHRQGTWRKDRDGQLGIDR
jgi:arylsulfatase A-like enzyme